MSGGDEEDRTPDPLRARQVLSQLSYTPISRLKVLHLVGTSGLEPPTSRLSGVRSNHLSYAPVPFAFSKYRINDIFKIEQCKSKKLWLTLLDSYIFRDMGFSLERR